jgi:predicted dehydrogenase
VIDSTDRIRVGVAGCGLIAQVMHLPNLRAMPERFELAALCDLSPTLLEAVGDAYGVERLTTSVGDLIASDVDAVMVLTSGSHAPIATAAVRAGRHVFVEKPLCVSVEEGAALVGEADRAGVRLMVGYMKRFDPGYERLAAELPSLQPIRAARLTTLESPLEPYVAHHPILRGEPPPAEALAALRAQDAALVRDALGDVPTDVARTYRERLLDSMVHELNAVRGLLGEPDVVEFASIRPEGVTAVLRFGSIECVASWIDLPGSARYRQEWAFQGDRRRALLELPSPFLRDVPTRLSFEDGEPGSPASTRTDVVSSYESGFSRELAEFHAAITEGREPRTSGADALADVALSTAIVRAHLGQGAIEAPTRRRHR